MKPPYSTGIPTPAPRPTHSKAATDAETAPSLVRNAKAGARERLRAAHRLQWLADSKSLMFRLSSVCALQGLCGHWLPLFRGRP